MVQRKLQFSTNLLITPAQVWNQIVCAVRFWNITRRSQFTSHCIVIWLYVFISSKSVGNSNQIAEVVLIKHHYSLCHCHWTCYRALRHVVLSKDILDTLPSYALVKKISRYILNALNSTSVGNPNQTAEVVRPTKKF